MSTLREKILDAIVKKSTLKQQTFDNTFTTFNELKDVLFEIASELDDELAICSFESNIFSISLTISLTFLFLCLLLFRREAEFVCFLHLFPTFL